MGNSYLSSIAQIMDRGRNANSYKFALLRALVTEVKLPGLEAMVIDNSQLSRRFIALYWPLTLRFKIRQATVPGKDPVVMRYIRKAISDTGCNEEITIEDFIRKHQKGYEILKARVARGAFRDVIPRFHTISGQSVEPRIYEIEANGITLTPEVQRFIFDNAKTLDLLAIGSWVKFTEKYTSSPRLYEKIQGLEPKRKALKKYAQFFTDLGANSCFYCQLSLGKTAHVDHVIPWRFVAEDKVWNLVLVCEGCNSSKSSMTPDSPHVTEVMERNKKLLQLDPDTLPVAVRKDLSEWRGGGLEQHFRMLLDHCRADGFGTWIPKL